MRTKLPFAISFIAVTLGVFLLGLQPVLAEGTVISSAQVTADGFKGKATISGTLSAEDKKTLGSLQQAEILLQFATIPGEQIPSSVKFIGNGKCTEPDSANAFVCTLSDLSVGTYVYQVGIFVPAHDVGTEGAFVDSKWYPFFPNYRKFVVDTTNAVGETYVNFNSATVSGHDAVVRVDVYHVLLQAQGYMQLGVATQIGATSNYTCTPGSWTSPAISVGPTSGENPVTAAFPFKNLPDGNYCVRVQAAVPPKNTLINVGNPSAIDQNGYFTSPGALFSVGSATLVPGATNTPGANPTGCVTKSDNSNYCLLAPLPGVGTVTGDLDVTKGVGDFFLVLIKIVMGLIGVLSVLMIVFGGIEYMTGTSMGEKEGGKSRMTSALFGLLLALGSYIILNTLNPRLVDLGVTIPTVKINLDSLPGGDGVAEDPNGVTYTNASDPTHTPGTPVAGGFSLNGGATMANPSVSDETKNFVKMLEGGTKISSIVVNAVTRRAYFYYKDANGNDVRGTAVSINIGAGGYSQPGTAKEGDKKTPLTTTTTSWRIDSNVRLASATNKAVLCRTATTAVNCGAAFIEFDSKNANTGGLKHTGFHGNASNTLAPTAGCIRMYNDDLVALGKYMVSGTMVYILEK
jgi:L,D-peptidoglycan transpeptidase YkuD (ErfK/YbiS/YcfS/YnhG family)